MQIILYIYIYIYICNIHYYPTAIPTKADYRDVSNMVAIVGNIFHLLFANLNIYFLIYIFVI